MNETLNTQSSMAQTAVPCVQETRYVAPADLQLQARPPDTTAITSGQYLRSLLALDTEGNCPTIIMQLLANAATRSPETASEVHHLCQLVQNGARLQSPKDFFPCRDDSWDPRAYMYFDCEDTTALSCLTGDVYGPGLGVFGDTGTTHNMLMAAASQAPCLLEGEASGVVDQQHLMDVRYPPAGQDDTAIHLQDATTPALSIQPQHENHHHLLSPTPSSTALPRRTMDESTPSTIIPDASPLEPGPAPPPPPPLPSETLPARRRTLVFPTPSPSEYSDSPGEKKSPGDDGPNIEGGADDILVVIVSDNLPPLKPCPPVSHEAQLEHHRQPGVPVMMAPASPPPPLPILPRVAEPPIQESESKQRRRKPPEEHDFSGILQRVREALGWDGRYDGSLAAADEQQQHARAREASFHVEHYLHQITAKLTRRRTVSYHTKRHAVHVIAHILISVVVTRSPVAHHVRQWCHRRDSGLLAALRAFSLPELDQFASDGFAELDHLIAIGAGFIFPGLELIRDFIMDRADVRQMLGYGPKPTTTTTTATKKTVKSKVETAARQERAEKVKAKTAKVKAMKKKREMKEGKEEQEMKKAKKRGVTKKRAKTVAIETMEMGGRAEEEDLGDVGGAEL